MTSDASHVTFDSVCHALAEIAPLGLAEDWDNVGLLVGDRRLPVKRLMTCLTISPDIVEEALREQVNLIVAHHPLPFRPLAKITSDTITGRMLLRLIGGNIAIYSAHTAFDSARDGINQKWADRLNLSSVEPMVVADNISASETGTIGAGRCGKLPKPMKLSELIRIVSESVATSDPRIVGNPDMMVGKLAVACGSGGSFLAAARRHGCDAMITGEATFHQCLEARSSEIGLGLLGHYWSERFAMEEMAARLSAAFPGLTIWPSRDERDPIAALRVGS